MVNSKGYFISGTDTGVGKTVVTACLLAFYKNIGLDTGVMKPIETGVDPECSSEANSDAKFLLEMSENSDTLEEICPIRLKPAASPLQAARLTNQTLNTKLVIESFHRLQKKYDQVLVEGIGGLMVPIKPGYFVSDLIKEMQLPLIIVSRISLGTLNHTLLTLKMAIEKNIKVKGVVLNHCKNNDLNEIELEQASLIQELSGVSVLGECPFINPVSAKGFDEKVAKQVAQWNIF